MNDYEDPAVYTFEQLRGYFTNYHTTGKHGRTRVDREAPEGYAARVQTEDVRLIRELEGAGFECRPIGDNQFLVAVLDDALGRDYTQSYRREREELEA